MDDSFEGGSTETAESGTETGTEVATGETTEQHGVTKTESASAFDDTVETGTSGETEQNTEVTVKTDAPVKTDGIGEDEVASAFDEKNPGKTTETKPTETKTEAVPGKTESAEPAATEKQDSGEVIHVNCTREDLAGKENPETGVPYETTVVEVNGKQLEVTVPKFESNFDTKLEDDQLQLDRQKHNDICNEKLKEYCDQNPEWAKENFSDKQLDQIKNGKKPEGYTWHHDGGEVGHMQLVDSKIHNDTRHTGGIAIWGNKSKYT